MTEQQQPQQPQTQQQAPEQPQPPIAPGILSFNTTAPEPQQHTQQPSMDMSAYDSIIAQQQAQIEALINQNNNLTQQVTQMVQNGAQFQQPQQQPQQFAQVVPQPQQFAQAVPQPQPVQFPNVYQPADTQAHPLSTFNPPALADDQDFSLEGLASEIGKRGSDV